MYFITGFLYLWPSHTFHPPTAPGNHQFNVCIYEFIFFTEFIFITFNFRLCLDSSTGFFEGPLFCAWQCDSIISRSNEATVWQRAQFYTQWLVWWHVEGCYHYWESSVNLHPLGWERKHGTSLSFSHHTYICNRIAWVVYGFPSTEAQFSTQDCLVTFIWMRKIVFTLPFVHFSNAEWKGSPFKWFLHHVRHTASSDLTFDLLPTFWAGLPFIRVWFAISVVLE